MKFGTNDEYYSLPYAAVAKTEIATPVSKVWVPRMVEADELSVGSATGAGDGAGDILGLSQQAAANCWSSVH